MSTANSSPRAIGPGLPLPAAPRSPRLSSPAGIGMTDGPGSRPPRRVIKGGAHQRAPSCCLRYQPAVRQGEATGTATCRLGLRCVARRGSDHDSGGLLAAEADASILTGQGRVSKGMPECLAGASGCRPRYRRAGRSPATDGRRCRTGLPRGIVRAR